MNEKLNFKKNYSKYFTGKGQITFPLIQVFHWQKVNGPGLALGCNNF